MEKLKPWHKVDKKAENCSSCDLLDLSIKYWPRCILKDLAIAQIEVCQYGPLKKVNKDERRST